MGLPAVVVMKNPNERLAFSVSVRRGEQRWAGHAAVIAILTETSQAAPLRIAAKSAVEESGSFLEQDSTAVPKFAYRSFCPCGNLVGECLPQTLLMRLAPLKNPSKYFFGFFKNSSASHPVFLLLVRGHHTQKGGLSTMKRYRYAKNEANKLLK